jgi:hypothetical protein
MKGIRIGVITFAFAKLAATSIEELMGTYFRAPRTGTTVCGCKLGRTRHPRTLAAVAAVAVAAPAKPRANEGHHDSEGLHNEKDWKLLQRSQPLLHMLVCS